MPKKKKKESDDSSSSSSLVQGPTSPGSTATATATYAQLNEVDEVSHVQVNQQESRRAMCCSLLTLLLSIPALIGA